MVAGAGDVGKTALIEQLTSEIADEFDVVFWRSLVNAPPPETILQECISFLAMPSAAGFATVNQGIRRLIDALRAQRCLLILDNLESILQPDALAGHYRPGYETYGQLICSIGAHAHQSCLLLISRETSQELVRLETSAVRAHILRLQGMKPADVHALLVTARSMALQVRGPR